MNHSSANDKTQAIDRVLDDLDQLSQRELDDETFFRQLLHELGALANARLTSFLIRSPDHSLVPLFVAGDPSYLRDHRLESAIRSHDELFNSVKTTPKSTFVLSDDGCSVALEPVIVGNDSVGSLLLASSENSPFVTQLLKAFAEIVSARMVAKQLSDWNRQYPILVESFAKFPKLNSRTDCDRLYVDTLLSIVNADRISLVVGTSGRSRIQAVGGQLAPNAKSEAIRRIVSLVDDDSNQRFSTEGTCSEDTDFPHYAILPVGQEATNIHLVLQCDDSIRLAKCLRELHRVNALLSTAWLQQRKLLSLPLILRGFTSESVRSRSWLSRALVGVALFAVISPLFLSVDLPVRCTGVLEPAQSSSVFASADGFVDTVYIDDGQEVKEGDRLLLIRSPELELELEETLGKVQVAVEQCQRLRVAMTQSATGSVDTASQAKLAGELAVSELLEDNLRKRLELLKTKREELLVKAPLSGTIISETVHRSLQDRPVRLGDLLFDIANQQGTWQIVTHVPDRDAGYVLRSRPLLGKEVEILLDNDTTRVRKGKVTGMGQSMETLQGIGQAVSVTVDVEDQWGPDEQQVKHIGATATVTFRCAKEKLWFVWTRPFVEYLQKRNWLIPW